MQLFGAFDGADIEVGDISGFIDGSGIFIAGATTDMAFRNVRIRGGNIVNVKHGFDSDAGSTKYQDIDIDGVMIDCDPFRVQSARAAGNKWASATASDPTCVHLADRFLLRYRK